LLGCGIIVPIVLLCVSAGIIISQQNDTLDQNKTDSGPSVNPRDALGISEYVATQLDEDD
jgi:hypothetical protein